MYRRIICTILCIAICCGCIVSPVSANEQSAGIYTEQELDDILFKFRNLDNEMNILFGSDASVVYWNLSNQISENVVLKWLLEAASGLIGEKPTKEDYVRILTNILAMKQGNLAEQINNQSQFDDLKSMDDYVWDVVDLAVPFIGGNKVADLLQPAIETALEGKDLIFSNVESAKCYEMILKDYAYANSFLSAICSNAKDDQLRNAAQSLLRGTDQLLVERLEYLADNLEYIARFESKFIYENLSFSLLKHTDLYATDEAIKLFVDFGSAFVKWAMSVPKVAFKATILAGDLWFGTSDTYNRYQEMKIISDIAQALVTDINAINLGTTVTNSTLTSINRKCDLYQMLILSHIRGEYLVYKLLTEDAGFASALKRLIDSFKDSDATVEGRYLSQIETLEKYYNSLYGLFPNKQSAPTDSSDSYANMESTFGFEKAWDIHDYYEDQHYVTTLAFNENGTFCCAVSWDYSEWAAAFAGIYQMIDGELILTYSVDALEKVVSYQVHWDDRKFIQTSADGLLFIHQLGSEIHFEESAFYTAADLCDRIMKHNTGSENNSPPPEPETDINTINALNALLIGVGYDSEYFRNDVGQWADEAIRDAIYGKLLWDNYAYSESSYLSSIGLKYQAKEDGYLHFNLELIQRITQDTFGRDFPSNTQSGHILVSGNELLIMQAMGESTSLSVQDFTRQGDRIIAVGTAVHNYNANGEFLGYFKAVLEKNPSSVYGYTLLSLSSIEGNQNFGKLSAIASSELKEATITHYAGNAIDGDLSTAWVEGVGGVGIHEWIKLETTDGSKIDVSAIKFSMGYQKSDQHLKNNGWPHKVLIECEGGYQQEVKFYEYTSTVLLDQAVTTSWIKITIMEVSKGSNYDDTCISEIRLYGIDAAPSSQVCAGGICGSKLSWTLAYDGTLTISGSGEMTNYYVGDDDGPPWLESDVQVTKIIFDGNITSIGENAFCHTSVREIIIPASVKAIPYTALDYIETLEKIQVDRGSSVFSSDDSGVLFDKAQTVLIKAPAQLNGTYTVPTSVTWICDNAFRGCTGLKTINWPSSISTIGQGAFAGCTSLEYVCIPSSVTMIDHYTFNNCVNLAGIRVSANIRAVGYLAFGDCNLQDVFYGGTEKQWETLMENCQDEHIQTANVYFESY